MCKRNLGIEALLAIFLLDWPVLVVAQNAQIIEQDLDGNRWGYTVMRVWGTHFEMALARATWLRILCRS